MITCAMSKPPAIPTTSMTIETPAATPLETPFFRLPPPPGWGLLEGVTGMGGGVTPGENPTTNDDLIACSVSVETKKERKTTKIRAGK